MTSLTGPKRLELLKANASRKILEEDTRDENWLGAGAGLRKLHVVIHI
ncbi:hypothetical protein AB5I83_11940 [Mesobacillus sp. LC4]